MKITILTYGSRGDIQPFLPLSRGLIDSGHQVILAAPLRFKNLIEQYGITFAPLAGDPEELSRRLNDAGYNYFKMIRELIDHAVNIGAEIMLQVEEASKDADLIMHTFAHAVGAGPRPVLVKIFMLKIMQVIIKLCQMQFEITRRYRPKHKKRRRSERCY